MSPAITSERWQGAQAGERAYWCDGAAEVVAARRQGERTRQQWYAELLRITPDAVRGRSVLDLGCGPQGLVTWPTLELGRTVALDPLRYRASDEAAYEAAGVERVVLPAEAFADDDGFDEVWIYNVLQHVRDPAQVLAVAQAVARQRVRLFEWVNVPPSVVHPHVTTIAGLVEAFVGWLPTHWVAGSAHGPGWVQDYVAAIWERQIA